MVALGRGVVYLMKRRGNVEVQFDIIGMGLERVLGGGGGWRACYAVSHRVVSHC